MEVWESFYSSWSGEHGDCRDIDVRSEDGPQAIVLRQCVGPREVLAAGGAGVGAVSSMGADVSRKAAGLRESRAAVGAGEGAVAGMDANVLDQVVVH